MHNRPARQSPHEYASIAKLVRQALSTQLKDIDLRNDFYVRHVESATDEWKGYLTRQLHDHVQRVIDNIKEEQELPADIVRKLNAIPQQEVAKFDFLAGLSLPEPHTAETLEDALHLLVFNRQMTAAYLEKLQQYHHQIEGLVCQVIPGFHSISPEVLEREKRNEFAAAERLSGFVQALHRLAKPPATGEEEEYLKAQQTVMKLPDISGVVFLPLNQRVQHFQTQTRSYLQSAINALDFEKGEEVKSIIRKYAPPPDEPFTTDNLDLERAIPALSGNPHLNMEPLEAAYGSLCWDKMQRRFLGKPLSDMLQPLFKKLAPSVSASR